MLRSTPLIKLGFLIGLLLNLAVFASSSRAEPTIVVVGDSISAGFGVPLQQGWLHLLEQRLQQQVPELKVVNAGVSGDTTSGGANRLPDLIETYSPELVVIELGGNDGLRGTPVKLIQRNLISMIEAAQNSGADVLLVGMQIPPNYGQRYAESLSQLYPTLAQQYNTMLLPFERLATISTTPGMMQDDGIHPSAAAQPLLADVLAQPIEDWLTSRSN
ncbi:arylesterase [Thalassolituus oleivorans]|uniref:arylesterase n=1 Tax=Thalassolituus oleivorans TaxID=187493 RepID=UPI0023F0BFB3|nr:arylesterase [Thalassolituus oleivorans]